MIGHLIHGERTDRIPRARIILEHGEARAFEPFDRFAQFEDSKGKSLGELMGSRRRSGSGGAPVPRSAPSPCGS